MDQKTHVTRLKKMLNRYPDSVCLHCPIAKNYGSDATLVSDEDCHMCQNFVKLKRIDYYANYNKKCPCFRPNPETAVKRALEYIALWERKNGEIKV